MTGNYVTVFDLISHPERINPPYGFFALFILIGVVSLGITILKSRYRRKVYWSSGIFSVLFLSFSLIMAVYDASWVFDARRRVENKTFRAVEGCLDSFHPGSEYSSRSTAGNEYWTVGGERFEYGVGEVRNGYHTPEPAGGFVHPDSQVRVAFVPSYNSGNKEIVRLEVIQHACPSAPDPKT